MHSGSTSGEWIGTVPVFITPTNPVLVLQYPRYPSESAGLLFAEFYGNTRMKSKLGFESRADRALDRVTKLACCVTQKQARFPGSRITQQNNLVF